LANYTISRKRIWLVLNLSIRSLTTPLAPSWAKEKEPAALINIAAANQVFTRMVQIVTFWF